MSRYNGAEPQSPSRMFDSSAEAGFAGLFIASFVAATLLPGGSEFVLVAVIHEHPEAVWQAIGVATAGNTLGAMTSYAVGRLIPNRARHRAIIHLHRYGYRSLLLSWLPFIGDALAVAAGWLRFDPWLALALMAIGKFARYALVAGGWSWIAGAVLPPSAL